jgi:quercetin dioxygenase-like cupin family protein
LENNVCWPTQTAPATNGDFATVDARHAVPRRPPPPDDNCISAVGCEFGCRCRRAKAARPARPGEAPIGAAVEEELFVARVIDEPKRIMAHGSPPKVIEEFIGRADSAGAVSIARMASPAGWAESGQTPDFDEYTLVLRGTLRVETRSATHTVTGGQAVIVPRGEWVRYSTPAPGGADYIAVCLPAFSPDIVHRDP